MFVFVGGGGMDERNKVFLRETEGQEKEREGRGWGIMDWVGWMDRCQIIECGFFLSFFRYRFWNSRSKV